VLIHQLVAESPAQTAADCDADAESMLTFAMTIETLRDADG
jgi:hypothetical protein